MPSEKLTQSRVTNAKTRPGQKVLELRDMVASGLELRVWPDKIASGKTIPGKRSWSFGYTRLVDGKRRRAAIGDADAIELDDAREKARELRRRVNANEDPANDRRDRREAITLRGLVDRRLGNPGDPENGIEAVPHEDHDIAASTRQEYRTMLARHMLADHGHVPADQITRGMVTDVMNAIEEGVGDGMGRRTADHLKHALSGTYRWGIDKNLASLNPTKDIKKRMKRGEGARTRVPSDTEVAKLWNLLNTGGASLAMRRVLMLTLLTGQRRIEVCGMQRSEVTLTGTTTTIDGTTVRAPIWIVPGDVKDSRGRVKKGRVKNRKEQLVPLPPLAAKIISEAMADATGTHVFPSGHTVKAGKAAVRPHLNEDSVTAAMIKLRKEHGIVDMTVHDARKVITTRLREMRDPKDGRDLVSHAVLDAILNHLNDSVTDRHYNFAKHVPETRKALDYWADHVERIAGGEVIVFGENVIELSAVRGKAVGA